MRVKRILFLGCGYTASRVALSLCRQGMGVVATTRKPARLEHLRAAGADVEALEIDPVHPRLSTIFVDSWDAVVYSIPTLRSADGLAEPAPALLRQLAGTCKRCIYLSTTGVYGHQQEINALTEPMPQTPRETLRCEAETAALTLFESPLVLRPAAIYGPFRGVHRSLMEGRYRLTGEGNNYISRIYVDDLAAHILSALDSSLTGAWPVADEHPCTQREMAEFCAGLLGLPLPPSAGAHEVSETLRANRRVDGSAVREALGLRLSYPTYREGVRSALQAEAEQSTTAG